MLIKFSSAANALVHMLTVLLVIFPLKSWHFFLPSVCPGVFYWKADLVILTLGFKVIISVGFGFLMICVRACS